jgi:L-ascorbate metabolism protein UlaG (beta-lactamase superfamily)
MQKKHSPVNSPDRLDQRRRRLITLAVLAGTLALLPRRAWAQTGEWSAFDRSMRTLRILWNHLTREPDTGDEEAMSPSEYVSVARPAPRTWSDGGITLSWIGHSTFLINLEGTTILTDPVFSRKVGPDVLGLMTIGIQRYVPPALPLADLPPIDLVLLSHAHMDHYDVPTLRRLPRDIPMILARDTTEFIDGMRFTKVQELDWGQSAEVDGVRVEAVPVKHWGRRYPWDRDRGYNGLLLTKHKRRILFGGDTAYTEELPAALNRRPVDVALLPIGGYNPYIANHSSPEQAWDLFHALEARYLIPMHWRTFRLSRERPFEPYERLSTAVNGSARRIALHKIGETWSLPG